jgi:spore maturation protein CgeB
MRVVFGYLAWAAYAKAIFEAAVDRARAFGYDVVPFCLTPGEPKPRFSWSQLDAAWRSRDSDLCDLHDRLREVCSDADIFWNVNGANVHPEWLANLPTLNVYGCFDDPESTAAISEPVARYFDAAFVGNLGCLPMYQSWGIRRTAWCPIGIVNHDHPADISVEDLLLRDRTTFSAFVGERDSPWRQERLDRLVAEFPDAVFRGNGWPAGRISDEERGRLYRDTRIGWNIHNSLGPINVRMFALPANGVLQICDNRCRLAQFMKLEHEVIGFDTIDECVDRTRYFLKHENERREIAGNGHRRYLENYSEQRIWDYYAATFREWLGGERRPESPFERLIWRDSASTQVARLRKPTVKSRLLNTVNSTLRHFNLELARPRRDAVAPPVAATKPAKRELNTGDKTDLAAGQPKAAAENLAFSWAIATLIGECRNIICAGNLAEEFLSEASADPRRRIVRRESKGPQESAEACQASSGPSVYVSINEVLQTSDFHATLRRLANSAGRVIVANDGSDSDSVSPSSSAERCWMAGEFHWVLRSYWNSVTVYTMPSRVLPQLEKSVTGTESGPFVAVCEDPREPVANGRSLV